MKTIKFLSLGLLATMIVSCSSDEVALIKDVTATISGNIGSTLKTRAHDTSWDIDDQIGLFVFESKYIPESENNKIYKEINDNRPFKTSEEGNTKAFTENDGKGAIGYPSNGDPIYFKAYYPYQKGISAENPIFEVSNWDQDTETASRALDLLVTNTSTKESELEDDDYNLGGKAGDMTDANKSVELKFRHIFSRLELTIKANSEESQIKTSDLKSLTATASNMSATASYNVLDGGDILSEANDKEFKMCVQDEGQKVIAIICPNVNPAKKNRVVTFTLTNDKGEEKTYYWDIDKDREEPLVFESGISYKWTIKLRGDKLATGELIGTIEEWGEVSIDEDVDLKYDGYDS